MAGIKESKEVLAGVAVFFGALFDEISEDGFQFADLAVAGATAYGHPDFQAALAGAASVRDELKDLSKAEFFRLVEAAGKEAAEELEAREPAEPVDPPA